MQGHSLQSTVCRAFRLDGLGGIMNALKSSTKLDVVVIAK